MYVGPRVTRELYIDNLDPAQSMRNVYVGALGGAHYRFGVLHLFGEMTALHVPTSVRNQVRYGGRWTVMPSVGVLIRLGTDHQWSTGADPTP